MQTVPNATIDSVFAESPHGHVDAVEAGEPRAERGRDPLDLIVVDQERERQNDTYLNGEKLAPGAREPLAAGDEIGFHNVGTGVVRED